MQTVLKRIILGIALLLALHTAASAGELVIVQITDPQIGFYEEGDLEWETDRINCAIDAINALKPDFVIFTGDMVQKTTDSTQTALVKGCIARIDPGIEILYVPGNHDAVCRDGRVDMTPYRERWGDDRFRVERDGVVLIGFNSVLLNNERHDTATIDRQTEWLRENLEEGDGMKLVFTHYPFFMTDIDDEDASTHITGKYRRTYLDMMADNGVRAIFSGHRHAYIYRTYRGMELVTASALGRPLGKAPSGVEVIVVEDGELSHRYCAIEEIPHSREELRQLLRQE